VGKEVRTLKVSGVIRPIDISPTNTIQSQYVGDFKIIYLGKGDQSAFSNQGWLGRIFNVKWPW
jgi:flagellar L-ring protein precursor FlgH